MHIGASTANIPSIEIRAGPQMSMPDEMTPRPALLESVIRFLV
jgi:hypothetical protein